MLGGARRLRVLTDDDQPLAVRRPSESRDLLAELDDGAGPEVGFARTASGEYRVGLRVVNSNGLWDVAYRFIRVTEVNRMPGFASTLPGPAYLRLAQGAVQVFSVSASDADGDPVVAHWFLDGGEVATGNDWSYATAAQDAGRHHVLVRLDDGSPLSPDNFYVWRVDVQTGADVIPESAVSRGFWLSPGEPNPLQFAGHAAVLGGAPTGSACIGNSRCWARTQARFRP